MEGRCRKPFLVLIFAVILTILTINHYLNPVNFEQKIQKKKTVITALKAPKSYPRQLIRITASDCYIGDFDYQDPRTDFSSDLTDVIIEVENGDFEVAKKIAVKRQYLGDAEMDFNLKGPSGHEGLFTIANTRGPATNFYRHIVRFDKKGTAGIVILVRKGQITTIYQESPRLMTLFQYTGTI